MLAQWPAQGKITQLTLPKCRKLGAGTSIVEMAVGREQSSLGRAEHVITEEVHHVQCPVDVDLHATSASKDWCTYGIHVRILLRLFEGIDFCGAVIETQALCAQQKLHKLQQRRNAEAIVAHLRRVGFAAAPLKDSLQDIGVVDEVFNDMKVLGAWHATEVVGNCWASLLNIVSQAKSLVLGPDLCSLVPHVMSEDSRIEGHSTDLGQGC